VANRGRLIAWVEEPKQYTSPVVDEMHSDGACATVLRSGTYSYPEPPADDAWGLWLWEGEIEASLSGPRWVGEWRRLKAQEAVVLAVGKNPLTVSAGDLLDEAAATHPMLTDFVEQPPMREDDDHEGR
jgi:hypothetical protein